MSHRAAVAPLLAVTPVPRRHLVSNALLEEVRDDLMSFCTVAGAFHLRACGLFRLPVLLVGLAAGAIVCLPA